jgi:hypothetical protein
VQEQTKAGNENEPQEAGDPQASAQLEGDRNASNFGTSLIAFALVLFCLFCAWYFGRFENDIAEWVVNAIFYGLAAILALISLALLINALMHAPSMRQLLLMLLGLGGGRRSGWDLFFVGGIFVLAAVVLHLLAITIFGVSGAWEAIPKLISMVLGFLGLVWLCISADGLLIKPFLEKVDASNDDLETFADRIRKKTGAAIPILIGIAGVLVALLQLRHG